MMLAVLLVPQTSDSARLGSRQPPVLYVSQWCQTDAQGRVVSQALQAHLGQPGSTADGLQASWTTALDQAVDAGPLGVQPVPWMDRILAGGLPGQLGVAGAGSGTGIPVRPLAGAGAGFGAGSTGLGAAIATVPTPADLLAAANQGLQAQGTGLAGRLAAALRTLGANTAWFQYRQQVSFGGQPVTFIWNLHADANTTWFAGSAALAATGTAVLAARYTSLAAAQGLPDGYQYPDGGWLRWQLLDASGQPVGSPQSASTAGAFDGPAGLSCLLGQAAGTVCRRPDLALTALALRAGAAQVDLQYVVGLQPAFAATQGGTRLAIAQLQVNRQLRGQGPGCSLPPWQFINVDQAAFQVQADLRHFVQASTGGWTEMTGQRSVLAGTLAPWRTLAVAVAASDLADLPNELIDPDTGRRVRVDQFTRGATALQVSPLTCQAGVPSAREP